MVIWKEHKQETDDFQAINLAPTLESLWDCGLLKYFRVSGMKFYIRLVEYIIDMWNPDQRHFVVWTHTLTIDIDDIYFLTGLSHRGRQVVPFYPQGGDSTLYYLIDRYYLLGMHSQFGKLTIKWIVDRTLRKVVYTIGKFVGTISSHMTTKACMLYAI